MRAASEAPGGSDHRARLTRFFQHHNPEKLSEVDTILTKYAGREVALFSALVSKYGPEPAGSGVGDATAEGFSIHSSAPVPPAHQPPVEDDARLGPIAALTGPALHEAIAALAQEGRIDMQALLRAAVPNQKALLSTFQRMYGDYENRLRRIFVRFEPGQLAHVGALLKRSQGQEERVIVQLLNRYGADAEPKHDAPTSLVHLTSRVKRDRIEDEDLFTDEEEERMEGPPESMFTAVAEARNLQADAERVAAGECSGDDEHTYPKDDEAWVRLRFDLTECDPRQVDEMRSPSVDPAVSPSEGDRSPLNTSANHGGRVTVCVGHVLDSYGHEKGNMCLGCSERVSKAFDCLWTPVGPQHRQAVLSSFVKEGYLEKLDRGGKWARRFFKVKDSGLHYFDSDKETEKPKPKGFKFFTNRSEVIENVSVEEHKIKNLDPRFFYFGVTVNHGNEPYFLRTNSAAERQSWVTFIKEAMLRLATSGACRDPNPGRWRARLDGLKRASEAMAVETSDSASELFTLKRRLDEDRAALVLEEEEVSLARTQANEMAEQELALQRLVEAGYMRLEERRAHAEHRKALASQQCEAIASQRTRLQDDLARTQSEVDGLKRSIAILHKQIIALEAEQDEEEAKCRKVTALYRRSEEKVRGSKLPSKVFSPVLSR